MMALNLINKFLVNPNLRRLFSLGIRPFVSTTTLFSSAGFSGIPNRTSKILEPLSYFSIPSRSTTIFTSRPSDQLWEGVTGPKGSTKKRARGKRRVTRPKVDLHRGQRLGMGRASMSWPGLNAPIFQDNKMKSITKTELNEAYFQRLEALRNRSAVKRKRAKLPPLLRGWTGSRLGGQSIGPPTPDLPNFDTRVIEMKVVATMTATLGRYRRFSALVATGNGQGIVGIGKAKSPSMNSALKRAKHRAAQNLISFNLKENRTLWHIGHVHEWRSSIFACPKVEGSGLVCHRLIRTLCEVIGIKDMHAKVEGDTRNYQTIARGFIRLLQEQESYSELANRMGLYVVEFDSDQDFYPKVLAAPATQRDDKSQTTNQLFATGTAKPTVLTNDGGPWKPILAITNRGPPKIRTPKPEEHVSFLNDLVDLEDDTSERNLQELLDDGERDLDALVLRGRVPRISRRPDPFYWKHPGVIKRGNERYRYRNLDSCKREREVYKFLDNL